MLALLCAWCKQDVEHPQLPDASALMASKSLFDLTCFAVQLLFNAADGFSRLALEHQLRPNEQLRAVLCSSTHPDSTVNLCWALQDQCCPAGALVPMPCLAGADHLQMELLMSGSAAAVPTQGGLPGLVMRLRQDGHGTLHLAGPAGLATVLESVQSFISWLHPAVQILESSPYDVPIVYKVRACLDDTSRSLTWQRPTTHVNVLSMCPGFVDAGQSC